MFARVLQFEVKPDVKKEFIKVIKNKVLPILREQPGFLEILPFFPEKLPEKTAFNISLWTTPDNAERYARETYPTVLEIVKPFLATPVTVKFLTLETTLCERFVDSLAA